MVFNCPRCGKRLNSVSPSARGNYENGSVRGLVKHYQQDCSGVKGDFPPITIAEEWSITDLTNAKIPRTKSEPMNEEPLPRDPYE